MSKSLQPKYRSISPGQGICRISTLRRSTLQGLMVVGLIVEEISNVEAKCVKVTGVWRKDTQIPEDIIYFY